MKQLSSFMSINADGGERISFTYNEISEGGDLISTNNKKSFFAMDETLKEHIKAIRDYINTQKLGE